LMQDFHAAPNLDHSNETVRGDICEWLKWLRHDVGFDSLRLDFSKGYGGQFAKTYIEAAAPEFAVGEYWDTCSYGDDGLEYNQDGHRQGIVNWIDQTGGQGTAFDFTTKGILQEACSKTQFWRLADKSRKPPGLMGVWPSHAVTFVDNHDTGSTQAHWPFPNDKILLGYCYLLTHPGTPFVMWDHVFDWGDEVGKAVREMVACRQECDVHSRSPVHIKEAKDNCYAAVTEGDNGTLAMKIGPGSWEPAGGNWEIVSFGKDYAIWIQT
jgi:alpha-amylase